MQNGLIKSFNGRMRDELTTRHRSSISTTPAPQSSTGSLTTLVDRLTRRRNTLRRRICRQSHCNRRPATQPRPAPPIVRCATRALPQTLAPQDKIR